ncbi:alpha/beta hydrolase domain-containing protein [Pseudorhodoferax sp. Leaf267]|uniref:alpha/beta hydrolase domain-containing protein n=1 Tax=Pseudorhodoferax sp. Leaf267 TaxID=1736316 RepID=UPI0007159D3E|nr:alpha/beta hydrolase domain-containing protein [Pseudorhodoferax sp. Leaf267]KQP17776.1 hypothetical protein ASF43_07830 [Pseudorhodoferax sp. Leaf267]
MRDDEASALRRSPWATRACRAVAAVVMACTAVLAQAAVPTPQIEGPIRSDLASADRNRTFFGTDLDLAARGYVEEEFFFSGQANRYDATVAGGIGARPSASPTAQVVSSGHAYKTRMVVRRPADGQRFNGKVIVEWMNATSNYDVEALWFRVHEFVLREGYAWVGITAQNGPIVNATLGLKQFSPTRYATLDLTAGGQFNSGDPLSYDVYAQGLQAVRRGNVMGPLSGQVRQVLAAGVSQSAGRLSVFFNAIHPRDEAVADAALLYIGGEKIRTDLNLPVLKLLSETEYTAPASANEINVIQPDTERIRVWSMAGTSHSDWASFAVRYALLQRDQPTAALADACAFPSRSRIPDRYVISSALDWLGKWAAGTATPPGSATIALQADGVTVQRDSRGNALGGIRLAPFAVPVALDSGYNEVPPGAGGLCFLNGTHRPFDTATLNQLYTTPQAYFDQFKTAATQNVRDGYVLQADADEMIEEARVSLYGRGLDCGALCANFAQFPIQPSTQLLRDHIKFLYVREATELLKSVDAASLSVARGYTASVPAEKAAQFSQGAAWLQRLQGQLQDYRARGLVTDGQSTLLNQYAEKLVTELRALGADPASARLDPAVVETLYGDEGGGGGCTIGRGAFDPMLWLMVLLAGGIVWRRTRARA